MAHSSEEELVDLYTIPSSSSWFKWDEIHDEERRSLPEFFTGSAFSRNPRVYREYRDFIVNRFREDPSRRLTFTEVRKSLVGDVGLIRKVFLCLDKWGLINFGVPGGGSGSEESATAVVVEDWAPAGVKVVPAVSTGAENGATGGGGESGFRLPWLTSYTDIFSDRNHRMLPIKGRVCGVCGRLCDSGEAKSTKGGYATCTKCLEKNNNTEVKQTDDVKVDDWGSGNDGHVSSVWTDAESLLLLEAVLKHGDDWDLIAQHVRTKSKAECIAQLIHLPLVEHLLGPSNMLDNRRQSCEVTQFKAAKSSGKELSEESIKELSEESMKAAGEQHIDIDEQDKADEEPSPDRSLKRRRFPSFADATGSLMDQVALLSTVAGPHVAAAAAESAVAALCLENPCAQKAFEIGEDEVAKFGLRPESELKVEDEDVKEHRKEGNQELSPEKNFGAMTFRIRGSVATSIGAAAARAKLLADQEEREMELLMATIIEMQLKKIRSKMRHFQELELIMEKEYVEIQKLKESILEDWAGVLQHVFTAGIPRWKDNSPPKFPQNANM